MQFVIASQCQEVMKEIKSVIFYLFSFNCEPHADSCCTYVIIGEKLLCNILLERVSVPLEHILRASFCAWYLRPFSYLKLVTLLLRDIVELLEFVLFSSVHRSFWSAHYSHVVFICNVHFVIAGSLNQSRILYVLPNS